MSWFGSSSTPSGPNFHPVQLAFDQQALFGPLEPQDTEWLCAGGFVTETQTFYATTNKGQLVMCQVIHSAVGLWYPSIQFTFRFVDQTNNKHVWKSIAVTNFSSSPSGLDKRSCRSDQFSITCDGSKYTIIGKYDDDVSLSLTFERLAQGFKVGAGPRGGMSYFGQSKPPTTKTVGPDINGGTDGYAVHRFWPRCKVTGVVRFGQQEMIDLEQSRGMFVHAIQGMRPNVLAASWNFANFQSPAEGQDSGVALVMMEFKTIPLYGNKKVNIGCIVVDDKLIAVTAGGDGVEGDKSTCIHLNPIKDAETDYKAPSSIKYLWSGSTLDSSTGKPTGQTNTTGEILLELKTNQDNEKYETRGLVEKVDVLGQIPYLIKKFVNYAAGTKPFIYTWLNPVKAEIATPDNKRQVQGTMFVEATFISE
ncbi:putative cell survival pathways protein [Microbotryomycetes sp. JL221]|nr:putative cell survival pathways protein [Microbotryomycetes sp. JL221]